MDQKEGGEETGIYKTQNESGAAVENAWEITKNLLDAHTRSGQALERYLLIQHLERETAETELRTTIEEAIRDHERIIEDLEAALENLPAQSNERN
ncbi:hypothetical protein [Natrinema sp. 1APR25-10V2]|uniref:hypothetical protein n=1 Tax=Natrinema sp. 1APR25-10V2 TaxID=2951081 RepID=UPI002874562D|nr:hypothetical protein [Natrinema sp. 1APR25-10V2]MDS0475678.1 hypothetical protein [Natrinema sp. 1APR25-10V2]